MRRPRLIGSGRLMLKPSRAKRLSDLLPQALGPTAAKQGFAGSEVMARWETIVGPEIAAHAAPLKLAVPRPQGPEGDGPPPLSILTLRVEGAFALEMQHRTPEILERVNAHLGWRCVGTIKLRQGSLAGLKRKGVKPPPLPPATEEERLKVRAATASVEESGLAEALARLGDAALATNRIKRS